MVLIVTISISPKKMRADASDAKQPLLYMPMDSMNVTQEIESTPKSIPQPLAAGLPSTLDEPGKVCTEIDFEGVGKSLIGAVVSDKPAYKRRKPIQPQ